MFPWQFPSLGTFATSNSLTQALGFLPRGGVDEVDDFCPFFDDGFQATCGWFGYFGWWKFTPRPCNGVRCELRIHAQYYLPVGGSSTSWGVGFGWVEWYMFHLHCKCSFKDFETPAIVGNIRQKQTCTLTATSILPKFARLLP